MSSDVMLYLWYRHSRTVDAERYVCVEWDGLATQPLCDYYEEVWDAGAAASQIKTPQTNPRWRWFSRHSKRLPPHLREFATGLVPLNGVLLSHQALKAVSNSPVPRNVFGELRLGSLLRSKRIPMMAFCSEKAATNNWHQRTITVSERPGLYHPVKTLFSAPNSVCRQAK